MGLTGTETVVGGMLTGPVRPKWGVPPLSPKTATSRPGPVGAVSPAKPPPLKLTAPRAEKAVPEPRPGETLPVIAAVGLA